MKIAVDGRQIGTPIGKGRYISELLHAFLNRKDDHTYIVYSEREHVFSFPSKVQIVQLPNKNQQRFMVDHAADHQADVFFSPTSYLPAILSPIPSVVTVHDLALFIIRSARPALRTLIAERLLLKKACQRSSQVITVSQSTKNDLTRLFGINSLKITSTPLGFDKDKFTPSSPATAQVDQATTESLDLPKDYLLFVGTIEPRKNLSNLLHAYSQLENNLKERYPLLIAGKNGWNYKDIYQTFESLNLKDSVRFLGAIDDGHLPSLYRQAKLFLFPSLYEGFGLPVIESIACGTPVITSCNSSLPEVAQNAGILIDPNQVNEINEAITTLLTNSTKYEELQKNCPKVASHFSWDRTAELTLEIFKKALN